MHDILPLPSYPHTLLSFFLAPHLTIFISLRRIYRFVSEKVTSGRKMESKKSKSNNRWYDDGVLESLVEDPTSSIREIAKELGSYRQKVWRKKKRLEEGNVVWGYTAVVDETKMRHVLYIVLLKLRPMSKELADLIVERITKREPEKQKVHLINVLYVNGAYDMILMFSAQNHATARRYYDSIRLACENFLLEKPVIADVNFSLVREGKINPQIEKLHEFIPT
jgi:DNA-binding Lrp family transcriptional regulator